MILLDKLGKRNTTSNPFIGGAAQPEQPSPLPTINQTIPPPPTQPTKPLTTTPMADKLSTMPERGAIGSMPQWGHIQKRFVADLPANMQMQGITNILSGKGTNNPQVDNFVKGLAAQGKSPEEIRQAFIQQQKSSPNPLVIL